MANRKLPFGYGMRLGKVVVLPQEAELIRKIYTVYAGGASYRQITEQLSAQDVPYCDPGKPWNKNMVARILANKAYLGTDSYPPIITWEEWNGANAQKPKMESSAEEQKISKSIRQMARCDSCGSRLELGSNKHGWARWKCPACNALSIEATTPKIKAGLTAVQAALTEAPEMVAAHVKELLPHEDPQRDVFMELLSTPGFDEEDAQRMAFGLAAAHFNSLDSEDYETMQIQRILTNAEEGRGLNIDLIQQITAAVLIHPDGGVSLQLKNGQVIERRHDQ